MVNLILAALAFVGGHFLLSSTALRGLLAQRLGERGFAGLFSLLAIAALLWLVMAFRAAQADGADLALWSFPGAGHLSLAMMPFALLLLVTGYAARNPTAVMQPAPDEAWRPTGIFTVTRHPIMWGIGLWALLHLAASGDLAGIVFFGAFAVLAFLGTLAVDAKKRRAWPAESWRRLAAATSNLPFLAIAQGRARLDWKGFGWLPLLITVALYIAIVWWFHPAVLGAPLVSQ